MNHQRVAARAFALLVLGAVCIGFAPLLVRQADVGPVASAFWRMLIATPVLWLVAWRQERAAAESATEPEATTIVADDVAELSGAAAARTLRRMAILSGLFFAGDLALWHYSITMTTVANATLLANCAPIVVTLYAFIAYRQRPAPVFVLALLLAGTGASALVGPNFRHGGREFSGDLLGLSTSFFYTAYMISINRAQAGASMLRLIAASTTVTAIALLPVAWWLSAAQAQAFWPATVHGWLAVGALAVISQTLGQGSIGYALTHLPVSLSATTLLLQPLVATFAAWLILGERLGLVQIVGGAVLLAAIWLARRSAR
jgi:drug/metabolite transporter (DMT)-like permease